MRERARQSGKVRSAVAAAIVLAFLIPVPAGAPALAEDPEPETKASEDSGESQPRRTWLLGHARSGRRRWVTGATVLATPESGDQRIYVTSTDEKGAYRLEGIPEGPYRVRMLKHGYAPVIKDGVELKFPFRAVVEVVMEPGGPAAATPEPADAGRDTYTVNLEGSTVERNGDAVDEVRVRLVRADGTEDPRDAMTDGEGRFRVQELLAGRWRVEVLGAGYLPIRVPVDLAGDATLRAVLVPQPANYEPQPLDLMPPEMPIPPPDAEPTPEDTVADAG